MEFIIIGLLIVYAVIKDVLFYKEREKLTKKIMSKDLTDYVISEQPEAEDGKSSEDPYIPVEEATAEQILKAIDKT